MITQNPEDLREQNKELVRRFYLHLHIERDFEAASRLLSPDFILHQPKARGSKEEVVGTKDWKNWAHAFFKRKKTLRFDLQDQIADESKVVNRWCMDGDEDGKPFKFTGISIFRIQDGLLAEAWVGWDLLAYYRQVWSPKVAA
jgi:ketosteroid isomerase-like protein